MASFLGLKTCFAFWAGPAPHFWSLKLCAGAVVREGRGAPVYAPAASDQHSTVKHMVFGRLPFLTLFQICHLVRPSFQFCAQARWFVHVTFSNVDLSGMSAPISVRRRGDPCVCRLSHAGFSRQSWLWRHGHATAGRAASANVLQEC